MLAEISVLRLEAQLRAQERAAAPEKNVFALLGRDLSAHLEKTSEPEAQRIALAAGVLGIVAVFWWHWRERRERSSFAR